MKCQKQISIFRDEHGFTTLSVVVSLLLTISLIFSTAQIYRICSASSEVQNVADASALAAENQVAEFMILVRVVDSIILSLSLSSVVVAAIGVVCMCTPVTFEFSDALLEASQKLMDARDSFAQKSAEGLNTLQKSLPFLSAVKAYDVAVANNGGIMDTRYLSIALLMPCVGANINPGNIDEIKNIKQEINDESTDIKDAANNAEESAKKLHDSKLRAFMADCGNNPNYCMYERAKNKAFLDDVENPLYKSVDTWNFNIALKRCQAYYPKRAQIEHPQGVSIKEKSDSALRKIFYDYASSQMTQGYVVDDGDVFDAYFPHLPKNTDEMKQTSMYSTAYFPVSSDGVIHAISDCAGISSISLYGSLEQLDSGQFSTCPYCELSSSSLGKVAQASTAIDNGYEYHYAIVEQASKEYKKAKEECEPANKKVKEFAQTIFQRIKEIIRDFANKRIYAKPPGSYGVICLTVNIASSTISKGFESSFVHNSSKLGVRAAISAATLIEENTDEGNTLISSLMDGLKENATGVSGILQIALDIWSNLLLVYSNGQSCFFDAIQNALNQIPLVSASGLGTWASKILQGLMEDLGLEPANIKALKSVLVNSYNVAKYEEDNSDFLNDNIAKTFASKYIVLKEKARNYDDASNSILSGISGKEELASLLNLDDVLYNNGSIEIAAITPFGDLGPSIPITIKLPSFATSQMSNILNWICLTIQGCIDDIWGGKIWR